MGKKKSYLSCCSMFSDATAKSPREWLPRIIRRELNKELLYKVLSFPPSFLASLPTSIMCGFAPLAGNSVSLNDLNSLDAVGKLISDASIDQLILGTGSVVIAQALLTWLNTKYLRGSTLTVLNLIKNDLVYLKNLILRRDIEISPSLLEHVIFIWCFLTSLIFAELGKETLAFLGEAGEQTGFYLNLLVYFATRFTGARMFFKDRIEHSSVSAVANVSEENVSQLKQKIIKTLGNLMGLCTIPSLMLNFIPVSMAGLQALLHSGLGADKLYQNPISMMVGAVAAAPTAFFYFVAVRELVPHLSDTFSIGWNKIKSRQMKDFSIIMIATLIGFIASFFTSIGFRMVGSSNIENGYLSYLNSPLERTLTEGLFISIILMFWAHLQHAVNAMYAEEPITESDKLLDMDLFTLAPRYTDEQISSDEESPSEFRCL